MNPTNDNVNFCGIYPAPNNQKIDTDTEAPSARLLVSHSIIADGAYNIVLVLALVPPRGFAPYTTIPYERMNIGQILAFRDNDLSTPPA